ncbi:MAG: hypothetical protein HYY04_18470 [Chloroflexi bacterium]|nr:hypothetical protein [Chloroflexota bacterium]
MSPGLFLYAIGTHARRRRTYPDLLGRPEFAHLHVVRLRSPRAADAWLEAIMPQLPGKASALS